MKPLLDKPRVYELFSTLVGAERSRAQYVATYVRPSPGDRILDIGCGPGEILAHLPEVDYLGFDINPSYIEAATRRYGGRGRFVCERVSGGARLVDGRGGFDIVLATGVLHHLDDEEARELFRTAREALRPGGRLVTLDGCYVPGQSRIARYLLSRDRGKFVRAPEEYVRLARSRFDSVQASVRNDLLRIPYTHVALVCVK